MPDSRYMEKGDPAIHQLPPQNIEAEEALLAAVLLDNRALLEVVQILQSDDFYRANQYRVEYQYLCQYFPYWHRGRLFSAPWKIYRYEPGCLDHLNYGRFGGRQAAVFMVVTKTPQSTGTNASAPSCTTTRPTARPTSRATRGCMRRGRTSSDRPRTQPARTATEGKVAQTGA